MTTETLISFVIAGWIVFALGCWVRWVLYGDEE
jgi:hypothetical protein